MDARTNAGGFSPTGLARVRALLEQYVQDRFVPGAALALARRGATHAEAVGTLAFEGMGAHTPMAPDTIVRMGSMTKPLTAACAMTLVEDGTVSLDDPVDDLLPELADMRVLTDPTGPLHETVAADHPITLRHLLDYTLGTGMVLAEPGTAPIADALATLRGLGPDDWLRGLGRLPLVHQPGERWLYDIAGHITGVLIARAAGTSFEQALRERICDPLGMPDTGFHVPARSIERLATAYDQDDDAAGAPVVQDAPGEQWTRPPVFERGGSGLVSTAADYLTFAQMLLTGGSHQGRRVLTQESVRTMTTDQLTERQREISGFWPGYFEEMGWGFGMSVTLRDTPFGRSAGSYGWPGFYGTAWYNDPAADLCAVVVMQRAHAGDQRLPMWPALWSALYRAIED